MIISRVDGLSTNPRVLGCHKKGQGRDALDGFSHLAYAGVRELVRTQNFSHEGYTAFMTCRHSGTTEYRYLNACDCMYWHCMLLLGGK